MKSYNSIQLYVGFKHLRIPAFIGAYDHEKAITQDLLFSLTIAYQATQIDILNGSDQLDNAHDYAAAAESVRKVCLSRHHELLENLSLDIMNNLRADFPGCLRLDLEIEKPGALQDAECSFCQVSWSA